MGFMIRCLLATVVVMSLASMGKGSYVVESEHWGEESARTNFALGYYDLGCAGLHWARKDAFKAGGNEGLKKFEEKHPMWKSYCSPNGY
jgi:hypothetical protein